MNAVNLKCKQEILMYQVKQPLSEKKQLTFWTDGHLSEYFCHLVTVTMQEVWQTAKVPTSSNLVYVVNGEREIDINSPHLLNDMSENSTSDSAALSSPSPLCDTLVSWLRFVCLWHLNLLVS